MLKIKGIASTSAERAIGLGNQEPLKEGEVFLLSFDRPEMVSIWNKGVDFPIDVGFINEKGELFQIDSLEADQEGKQNPLIFSRVPTLMVLETAVGELAQYRLGQTVDTIIEGENPVSEEDQSVPRFPDEEDQLSEREWERQVEKSMRRGN